MRKIIFLFLIQVILFSSCSKQEDLTFANFDLNGLKRSYSLSESVQLEGKFFELDTVLTKPIYLALFEGNLFVSTRNDGNLILEFTPSGKLVRSFLPKGSGPKEAMTVSGLKVLYDSTRQKSLFAFDKMLKRGHFIKNREHRDFRLEKLSMEIVPVADSLLIVQDLDSEYRFGLLNIQSQMLSEFGIKVEHEVSDTPVILNQAFQGYGGVSRDNSTFIFASKFTDRIEIYDLSTLKLTSMIRGPLFFEPIFQESQRNGYPMFVENEKGRFSYIDICVGEKYFYLLYSGESREENPGMAHYGKSMFVVDFDGNIVGSFKFDHPLLDFEVDEEDSLIYGLDVNTYSDEKILVYNFDF